jgi:hypothetical protein
MYATFFKVLYDLSVSELFVSDDLPVENIKHHIEIRGERYLKEVVERE